MPDSPRPQRDRNSIVWFFLLSAALNGAAVVSGYWIKFPERSAKPETVIELTDLDVNDVEKLGNPDASAEAAPPEPEPTPPPPPPEEQPTPPPVDKPEFELPEPTPPPLPLPSPTPAPTVVPTATPLPRPLATPKPHQPQPPLPPPPAPKPPRPPVAAEKPRQTHNPNAAATPGVGAEPGPRGNPAGAPNGTGHAGHPGTGAVLLRSPKPPYPPQALQMGIRGDVRVQFTVSNGNILDVKAISGPPMLSSTVVRWTRANWKFAPNVNGTFTLPVTFQMQ
ncbi:MAG: TonB family protein [Verrucomicrobia bacterium]|nr:TonB family protein [Verrucomicrobiota bacterium]